MKDYEDVTPYIEKILRYAARNAAVFLVIDNVDQFEAQEYQASIFSDAMALSRRIGANLVLAMRDATYVKHRSSTTLDAFDFDPIYIDPPKVEAVLSKRFFVARQVLSGQPLSFITETGVRMELEDASILIDLIQSSVLGTEVGEIIDVLASADIRLALRMTREFLQYGYTATGYALHVYQTTGAFQLPRHEALRAIMLGNNSIYNSATSVISNPFDANVARSEAQLLRLLLLSALVQYSSESSFSGLAGERIREAMRQIGFGDEITLQVLDGLVEARFAQTVSHGPASFEANYLPTRLGGHIVRRFIANFAFLENVLMDTFISDEAAWDHIRGAITRVYQERDRVRRMDYRAQAVRFFFAYLKAAYSVLRDESVRRGLSREWCADPFEVAKAQFENNVDAALQSAAKSVARQT